jgi:hypothetical protein
MADKPTISSFFEKLRTSGALRQARRASFADRLLLKTERNKFWSGDCTSPSGWLRGLACKWNWSRTRDRQFVPECRGVADRRLSRSLV